MPKTTDFAYELDPQKIAQEALDQRDASRLLVLDRKTDSLEHRAFTNLVDYLQPGDVIVANDSRVIPARLFGRKVPGGGKVELLLLDELAEAHWRALVGGRRIREGTRIRLLDGDGGQTDLVAEVVAEEEGPVRQIRFDQPLRPRLAELGHTPLPPYIHKPVADPERYQTVYARRPGSAAAPTAGLHFTGELLL
ncbi:MAG: S-adenosylmethionine:tRNA ribosyltransferase-isomerase, partial [Candidatus Promineifilaceae bacterium]|nr:S-adenosylmethionine:tRNA ribosyltransferase-isomerase [Candidatus Promineifilaceae bacterium]